MTLIARVVRHQDRTIELQVELDARRSDGAALQTRGEAVGQRLGDERERLRAFDAVFERRVFFRNFRRNVRGNRRAIVAVGQRDDLARARPPSRAVKPSLGNSRSSATVRTPTLASQRASSGASGRAAIGKGAIALAFSPAGTTSGSKMGSEPRRCGVFLAFAHAFAADSAIVRASIAAMRGPSATATKQMCPSDVITPVSRVASTVSPSKKEEPRDACKCAQPVTSIHTRSACVPSAVAYPTVAPNASPTSAMRASTSFNGFRPHDANEQIAAACPRLRDRLARPDAVRPRLARDDR